jgi:TonB family protein
MLIGWALFGNSLDTLGSRPATIYAQVIAPHEKKIVWYHLQELPAIAPTKRIGTAPVPQGREKRNDVMIGVAAEAKPGKQLVWRPDVEKELEEEAPSPNLVAIEAKQQTVKVKKSFSPPPATQREARNVALDAPPEVQASQAAAPNILNAIRAASKPIPKPFLAPSASLTPHLVDPDLTDQPLPSVGAQPAGAESLHNAALEDIMRTSGRQQPRRAFVPPSSAKKPGEGAGPIGLPEPDVPSGGAITAVVLSTSGIQKLIGAVPEGNRPAEISGAPNKGQPSSGAGSQGGLQIPGVAVQPGNSQANPASGRSEPGRAVYEETRVAAARSTLSVPLRPSSRSIPQWIESRFHGRVVYTMIIPMPRMPMYNGDWILWFAEREPKPGATPQVRAPLPVRKVEPLSQSQSQPRPAGRVRLAATILKNGRPDSVSVLGDGAAGSANQTAVSDFQNWQFLPAWRGGESVDVDIVIEIAFQ